MFCLFIIIVLLIGQVLAVNSPICMGGLRLLMYQVVEILSSASPSVVNSSDEEGWAPLHSAASSGNLELVEILLNRGEHMIWFMSWFLHILC